MVTKRGRKGYSKEQAKVISVNCCCYKGCKEKANQILNCKYYCEDHAFTIKFYKYSHHLGSPVIKKKLW